MVRSHESYPYNQETLPFETLYEVVIRRLNEAVQLTENSKTHQYLLYAFRRIIGVTFDLQDYVILRFIDDIEKLYDRESDANRVDVWVPVRDQNTNNPDALPLDHKDMHFFIHGLPQISGDKEPVVRVTPRTITIVSGKASDIERLALDVDNIVLDQMEHLLNEGAITVQESHELSIEETGAEAEIQDTNEEVPDDDEAQQDRRYWWTMGVISRIGTYSLMDRQKIRPYMSGPPDIESLD